MKLEPAGKRSGLLVASTLNFLSFLDTTLLIPVMALYASMLGASPAAIGFIIGLYSIANTPANIFSGRWIDRAGYKLPLIAGLAGSAASMLAYSLTRLPLHLALVRLVHGIFGGLKSPAIMATFTGYAAENRRGKTMAFYGLSLAAANLAGFSLSGVIVSRLGYQALFLFGAAVLAAGTLLTISLPGDGGHRAAARKSSIGQDYQQVKGLLKNRGLLVSYCSIAAQYFAFGGVVTLLPLQVKSLGMSAFHVGMLLTAFTVAFIALQFPSGALSDRIGRMRMIYAGLGLGALALVLLPLFSTFPVLAVIMAAYGAAFGILFPSVSALIADHALPAERGIATGVFHALLTAGVAIGAPVFGGVAGAIGIKPALELSPIILVAALAVALTARRGNRQ